MSRRRSFFTHASEVDLAVLAKPVIALTATYSFCHGFGYRPISNQSPMPLQINLWHTAWVGGHHVQQEGWGSNASRHGYVSRVDSYEDQFYLLIKRTTHVDRNTAWMDAEEFQPTQNAGSRWKSPVGGSVGMRLQSNHPTLQVDQRCPDIPRTQQSIVPIAG